MLAIGASSERGATVVHRLSAAESRVREQAYLVIRRACPAEHLEAVSALRVDQIAVGCERPILHAEREEVALGTVAIGVDRDRSSARLNVDLRVPELRARVLEWADATGAEDRGQRLEILRVEEASVGRIGNLEAAHHVGEELQDA